MATKVKKLDQPCTKIHHFKKHLRINNQVSRHKKKVSSFKKTWVKLSQLQKNQSMLHQIRCLEKNSEAIS
ncbi:hypothetical protein SESBI_01669 [Sesbania bispinosa]|nr:hypothetical protein SESBI_01669 [Sesbania bispinosa]